MRSLCALVVLAVVGLGNATSSPASSIPPHDPHTLIIRFKPTVNGRQLTASLARSPSIRVPSALAAAGAANIRPLFPIPPKGLKRQGLYDSLDMAQFFVVQLAPDRDADKAFEDVLRLPEIAHVEFNAYCYQTEAAVAPNDYWYLPTQWNLRQIGMESAWAVTTGSTSVVVAIIDSGVDYLHPDLASRIGYNLAELYGIPGVDDDLNGYVDDVAGWNFADKNNIPAPGTDHGTHVAGIIGAVANNSIGIAGLDWNCLLFPVRVLNASGSGLTADIIQGVYYSSYMGCKVINMSLGGPPDADPTSYLLALNFARLNGSLVVAAMGNKNVGAPYLPAASVDVMAVGATDTLDQRWVWNDSSGSNYGSHIDVCAPGDHIFSTIPCPSCPVGLYDWKTGTSMAAPHVSALAALLLSVRPTLTPDSLYFYIASGVDDQVGAPSEDTPGWDQYHGWGRINAYRSLSLLTTTDVEEIAEGNSIPASFALLQNYPNPFNSATVIPFETRTWRPVELEIFNILGQRIYKQTVEDQPPGRHSITWDGRDQSGRAVPSGLYLYRVTADGTQQTRKMVVLK